MRTSRIRLLGLWIAVLVSGFGIAFGGSGFVTRKTCKILSKQYVAFAENGCGLFRLNTKYSRGCGNVEAHAGKNFCLVGYSEAYASNGPGGGKAWVDRKGGGWAGSPGAADAPEDSASTNLVEATVVFEPDRQVVTVNLALAVLAATTNGAVSQIEVILWREDFDGDETLTPSKTLSYGSLVVKDGQALAGGSLEGIGLDVSSSLLAGFPATTVQIGGQILTLPVPAGTDFDSLAVTIRVDGGHGEITPASDWTSPGYEWTPLTEAAPPARVFTGLAEDGVRGRIVLFGGRDVTGSLLNDTWEWIQPDGPWQQVATDGLPPQPRQQHAAANLFGRRFHTVIFGGLDPATTYLRDTWAWDGGTWQLLATNGPSQRALAAMAPDQPRQRVLLFGGLSGPGAPLGDTWSWNGTAWSELSVPGPSPRSGHAMAYNPFGQRIILFGGEDATGLRHDTWEWDGGQWSLMSTTGPPARRDFAMARKDTRIALFGGRDAAGRLLGDTWEWNGTNWTKTADDCPTPRSGHAMSSDAFWGSPLLFGGADASGARDDTWRLHGVLFKRQPAALAVDAGQPAAFTVELAAGATTPAYQWERDCGDGYRPISGATNSTHAISAAVAGDACQYRCVVLVAGCLVASQPAALSVRGGTSPPVIAEQPVAVTLEEGDVASFSVTATGAAPVQYQWLLDDVPIQDATNAVLLLGPVTTELSGTVSVQVSNGGGTLVSQGAPLTVTPLSNNATGTRVPVDATICFSNAGSGAVADCVADWAAQGKATFQGGTYAAQTVHTRQARWCSIAAGPSTLWWPCHFNDTSDPTVPIPAGGPVAVSGTGVTSINRPLLLLGHAAYWQNHCTVRSNGIFAAGWEPAGFGYVHQVNVKMILGNGDEYVFAPKNSPPLGAKDLTPACPPEPMTICECPTVVELCFEDCATGLPVEINGDSFTATIDGGPFNGVQQASGTIGKAMCRKILLRSGEKYKLTIDYHTGTDYFTDRINWRTTVDVNTTNHNCSNAGPLTVPVPCFRDPAGNCIGSGGDPSCPFGEAHGNLNMLCECEHDLGSNWSFLTASGSWNGALQHRWDHVGTDAATGCAEGRFDLMNLPTGMSPSTYSANGRMSFRTGNSYQWLQTPASSFTVQCDQRVDLGDTFVLDCGWVKGDIRFCGPVGCCLLSYIYREPNPELTGSFLDGSSYIRASGPAGAQSRGHFSGSTTPSPGCDFLGDYSLSLGGLNKGVSTWTANQMVLRYLNAAPHIDSTVTITDRLFPPQTITPGATVTNDHEYCFSTVTINFNVQTGGTGNYTPSVTASGSFVGTTGCLGEAADYSVHAVATGPSGPNPNQVVLSLPQGTYDFTPGITSGGHWTGLLPIKNVPVGCKVCIEIAPGLALVINDPPDCVSTNRPTFNVWLQNSNPAQILVNGIPTGPVIPANTVGAIHPITVPAALIRCANNVVVTAQDTGTPPLTVSQTLKVIFDDEPPVISGCQDLHVTVPAGQSGATVTLPAVTATDKCGPVSVTCSAGSGFFPVGETRVKCSATDACGNTTVCEYTVTVDVCVGVKDVRVDCNRPASDFLVTFTYENPGPDPVSWLYFAPLNPCATVSPGFFHFTTPVPPGGQVTLQFTVNLPAHCPPDLCLQFTALNAQLMACCTVERCLELMDITCPEDIVVDCQDERGAWVDFGAVTAGFNGTNLPVRCDLTSPAWFPIGVTPVTCTYLDLCTDRERICKFTVTVRANGPGAWVRARNDVGNPADTRGSIGLGIATDQCGDTVYVGSYDDGPLQVATVTLGAFGGRDGYLVKQDPLGNVLWAVRMGTAGGDEARAVATDAEGNIYVTGHVDGTLPATFDSWPTGSTTLLPVAGSNQQIFVARYDPQGVLQWFTRHGGSGDDAGIDIAVDGLGRPVVAGQWSVSGATEAFVARFGPWSGAVVDGPLWTTGGAGRTAVGRGIALDGLGNAYLVGNHAGPTTFPPLALGLPSGGFIAKASPTLSNWAWARETYGNADLRGVGLDPTSGDVFITGYFNGTIKLDQAPLGSLSVANAKPGSLYDYLLARLDPATGRAHWLIKGGGIPTTAEETRDLAVDDQGNCYVTGFIHDNAPSPWVGTGQRVLVASYSGLGHIRWTRHADGGVSPAQAGHSLAVDAARCVHVTGEFTPALNFPNPPFTAPIPGLSLPAPPALAQTWVGHICPVCPCQDTNVDVRMHELSTGWNGAGGTAIPPGQADDDWVWYDPTTQTTQPAFIAGPAFGSPSRAPVMYQGGSWRLRHCLRLPGCIATQIRVHASSDDTSPNGISIYLNGNLVTTGAGNLGVTAILTSGLTGGQDCLEITTQSDLPIAVAADVQALCGCGEIAGSKFNDANADRVRGGSESGLPNWLVTFTDNTGNVIGSALTGTAGAYQSGLLFGGAYQVCEVQQSGWLQTFPATGCHNSVQVVPGSGASGVDFGNARVGTITWDPTRHIGSFMIMWTGDGRLHTSAAPAGPWQVVPDATSPYAVPTTSAPQQFFQVIWP